MKRSDFFKSLLGIGAVAIVPKSVISSTDEKPKVRLDGTWKFKDPELIISSEDYRGLMYLYDDPKMHPYETPVKYCSRPVDDKNILEWREWDLEILRRDEDIIDLLRKEGFNLPV